MTTYNKEVFDYITANKDRINQVANQLGVSANAIAGSVAEEANSIASSGKLYQLGDQIASGWAQVSNQELIENYNYVHLPENRDLLVNTQKYNKPFNPVLNDIGIGNIKVSTAIDLLNNYSNSHPTSDPLGIKYLTNDYTKLVDRIIDPTDNLSITFAGLMTKEATDFFSQRAIDWNSYDATRKEGLIITYYNLGKEKMNDRYNNVINQGLKYDPQVGDGGIEHLQNIEGINKSLNASKSDVVAAKARLEGNEVFDSPENRKNPSNIKIVTEDNFSEEQQLEIVKKINLQNKTVTFQNTDGSFAVYKIDDNLIKIANQNNLNLSSLLIASGNNSFATLAQRQVTASNGGSMYVYRLDEKIKITNTDNDFDYKPIIPQNEYNKYLKDLFSDVVTVKSYYVKVGDTLSQIAARNNTTVNKILELNDISDINKIQVGQVIKLENTKISEEISVNEETYKTYSGNKTVTLKNSLLFTSEDPNAIDSNGNKTTLSASTYIVKDNDNNDITLVRDNVKVEARDGSFISLDSIIETIDSAKVATEKFVSGYLGQLKEMVTNPDAISLLISDVAAGIQRGDSPEEIAKYIATRLAVKQLLDQGSAAIKNEIQQALVDNPADKAAIEAGNYLAISKEGSQSLQKLDKVTESSTFEFGYKVAIMYATTILLSAKEGWDSQEYTEAGVQVVSQAVGQAAVQYAAENGWFGEAGSASSGAAASGVGAALAYLASAAVNDLFADDHMNSHQWKSTVVSAAVIGVAAAIGWVLGGGPVGAVIATIIVSQFMGGKEYKDGQYPDPYSFLDITPKADGTGNIIRGLESDGVVAIARDGYHDDIYGNSGSDTLIGKSGRNTIMGYGGNDHLEGRGDDDLLVGGEGDDEIFGGGGDDKIYGSQGKDNLFGGAGNDIIVGGTGESLAQNSNDDDGADFIQGGLGDDQIMGEDGDDEIQGNEGNDIILGGAGNDRIEGNQGDDSILGEDGDDTILGGAGADVIDGGVGKDYIEGGAGNDNIRGGDGDDEIYGNIGVDIIYGDAGNDLVNAGSENDLVFGGLGNDILYGGSGDDTLAGEFGADYLIGGEGNDTLDGGIGDDVIFGGVGADIITTGDGNDTIIYRAGDGSDTITETENLGNDILRLSEINSKLSDNATNKVVLTKSGNDLLIQFKNDQGDIIAGDQIKVTDQFLNSAILKKIEFFDGQAIDLTSITVNPDNSISYSLGSYSNIDTAIQEELALGYNDQMQFNEDQVNPNSSYYLNNYNSSGEQDEIDNEFFNEVQWRSRKKSRSSLGGSYTVWEKYYERNVNGTNANDRLVGNWWGENVYGGDGEDQLIGGDGGDNIDGENGDDIIHGGAGNDTIKGQAGKDLIYGGVGDDNIDGGNDDDKIYGNSGKDLIQGGLGDDYLEGGAGDDNISDNSGNNIIVAGSGIDIINTGAGNDRIEGNDGGDTINAGDGNNLVYGNGGADAITTGSGNDTIYGQDGGDLINSGAGDDYVSGGSGDDVISGGDGNDTVFGDLGVDQISGGAGNDFIYGGSGGDILTGDLGNDQIKAGDGDDWVEGNEGNDKLYGDSGNDKIYGNSGNDEIYGGNGSDVLEGGEGNDSLNGGIGNDILVDGAGSDILDGGGDQDILILTKEDGASSSIDRINNFNADEDKIILKVNYQAPITFLQLQSQMNQVGSNVEINLDNGQKIIIANINKSQINENNFAIGLANNDGEILFGTDGNDILFGDDDDNTIYGGDGNDELWGGKGADALYGEGGNDILRYEVDGKYIGTSTAITSDEIVYYWGYSHRYVHPAHFFNDLKVEYKYSKNIGEFVDNQNLNQSDDVFVSGGYALSKTQTNSSQISKAASRAQYEPFPSDWVFDIDRITKVEYIHDINLKFGTKNFYNNQIIDITGYNRTFDLFDGGTDYNTILMTAGDDVLALDDPTSSQSQSGAKVKNISVIYAGDGNDIINFSSPKYSYGNVTIYGGNGNDKIWSNAGNDSLLGGNGDDEIFGGAGNDTVDGGEGEDEIHGGVGNDILNGNNGSDKIYGDEGDDLIMGGSGADHIDGGAGNDTMSYQNATSAININLSSNIIPDGDVLVNIENIVGTAYNDNITTNFSANIITGGAGNDILSGGDGNDVYVYNDGDGVDTLFDGSQYDNDIVKFGSGISFEDLEFSTQDNDLIITIGGNANNKLIIKNQFNNDNTSNIEYLEFGDKSRFSLLNYIFLSSDNFAQSSFARTAAPATMAASQSQSQLLKNGANATINGNLFVSNNIDAGIGDDIVTGGNANDILKGGSGDDTIFGGAGNDELYGNEGNDILYGQDGDDVIYGNDGDDYIDGGNGNNRIDGGSGKNVIFTLSGNDEINTGDDNDIINAGAGNNVINAGNGTNRINSGEGNDRINSGSGNDTINAGNGDNVIYAGSGNNNILTGTGSDEIHSDQGNDIINSGAGNDTIYSGDGDDEITAGVGKDIIFGGAGSDIYNYNFGDGEDIITNANQNGINDKIKFGSNILRENLILSKVGNDLVILFKNNVGDRITVKNHFLNDQFKIKSIDFSDGYVLDVSGNSFAYQEYNALSQISEASAFTVQNNFNSQVTVGNGANNYFDIQNENNLVLAGDGDDLIYLRNQKKLTETNLTTVLAAYKTSDTNWASNDVNPKKLGDINGDGKVDIVAFGRDGTYVSLGNGNGTFGVSYKATTYFGSNANYKTNNEFIRDLADINGDGIDDIVKFENGPKTVGFGINTTITYSNNLRVGIGKNTGSFDNEEINNDTPKSGLTYSTFDQVPVKTGDLNNDKIDDFVFFTVDGVYAMISDGDGGYASNGYNTTTKKYSIISTEFKSSVDFASYNKNPRELADVNGDGKVDIIAFGNDGVYVSLAGAVNADGINTFSAKFKAINDFGYNFGWTTQDRNPRKIADMNGDGRADIVGFADDGIYVSYGQIDGTFGTKQKISSDFVYNAGYRSQNINNRELADVNGDGKADIIAFGSDGVHVALTQDVIGNNNIVRAGTGNDSIFGDISNDEIYGEDGDDKIFGRAGNDKISGGAGNDILNDGYGSDTINAGSGNDIIVINKENSAIDTIEDFNPNEDKIILKTDYKDSLTFANIQSALRQNAADAEITLSNGQKIILKNINISAINANNFSIGLTNQTIENSLNGNGSNIIYDKNQNNILDYVVNGNYTKNLSTMRFFDENLYYTEQYRPSYQNYYSTGIKTYYYKPSVGVVVDNSLNASDDVVISKYKTINVNYVSNGDTRITLAESYAKNEPKIYIEYYQRGKVAVRNDYVVRLYYDYSVELEYATKNFHNNGYASLGGYNKTSTSYDGAAGDDALILSAGNDFIALDDPTNSIAGAQIKNIEAIYAGGGNDIINLSSTRYNYQDVTIDGGDGDDRIWSNIGNDKLFGGFGVDEIFGGAGDDIINGGAANDDLNGGAGNDTYQYNVGDGTDTITESGADNSDVIEFGAGINRNNITLTKTGNDLVVTINGNSSDKITIKNQFSSNVANRIEQFKFSDGSTLDTSSFVVSGSSVTMPQTMNAEVAEAMFAFAQSSISPTITISAQNGNVVFDNTNVSTITNFEIADINYTPNANFYGIDNILYQLFDEFGNEIFTKTYEVFVTKVNSVPQLLNVIEKTVIIENEFQINLAQYFSDSDNDKLTYKVTLENGDPLPDWINFDQEKNIISGTPGIDQNLIFKITADDSHGGVLTVSANLNIIRDNYAPISQNIVSSIKEDESILINLFEHSSDPDGDQLIIESTTSAAHGKIEILQNGIVKYTPNENYFGEDKFNFTITDGKSARVTKEVKINIESVNDAPIISAKISNKEALAGNALNFMLPANVFSDVDSSALTYSAAVRNVSGQTSPLPTWLVFDPITKTFTGNLPSQFSANIILVITASDGIAFASQEFNINIINNLIVENAPNALIEGTANNDAIVSSGANPINSGDGDDTIIITGYLDDVKIDGGNGEDILVSNSPYDVYIDLTASNIEKIYTKEGNDVIIASANLSKLTIDTGSGDDYIEGGDNDDIINGGDGDDEILGKIGSDIINGGNGDDIIRGGRGNDIIIGGVGQDTLHGGKDHDIFTFTSLADSTFNSSDLIADFAQGEDKINLSDLGFSQINKDTASDNVNSLIYHYDNISNLTIIENQDQTFQINLSGKIELNENDFIF